jgi:TonB-dependent SusC/RagA subfamily outer membrane receptor
MRNLIKKTIVTMIALTCLYGFGLAQDKSIRGIVISSDSIPLINAEITVKSPAQKSVTDSMGTFQVVCKPSSKITIQAEGFANLECKASEISSEAIFVLEYDLDSKGKNKVVYDAEKMRNVILVNGRETDITGYKDVFDILTGRVPGVDVVGDEGGSTIVIRGISTVDMSSINNGPLIVIDNIAIQDRGSSMKILEAISPNDLRSIQVIKEGGELSMYGSRGSNGVIKIKTKKG